MTQMAAQGMSDEEIKRAGRWKSNIFCLYIWQPLHPGEQIIEAEVHAPQLEDAVQIQNATKSTDRVLCEYDKRAKFLTLCANKHMQNKKIKTPKPTVLPRDSASTLFWQDTSTPAVTT